MANLLSNIKFIVLRTTVVLNRLKPNQIIIYRLNLKYSVKRSFHQKNISHLNLLLSLSRNKEKYRYKGR